MVEACVMLQATVIFLRSLYYIYTKRLESLPTIKVKSNWLIYLLSVEHYRISGKWWKKRKSGRVTACLWNWQRACTGSSKRLVGDDILTSFYRPLKVEAEFGETLQSVMSIQRKEREKEETQKKGMKIKPYFQMCCSIKIVIVSFRVFLF